MASKHKTPRHSEAASSEKRPRFNENPNSYYNTPPAWAFKMCDFDHPRWGINANIENLPKLIKALRDLEGQTWQEITMATREHNTKNHTVSVEDIIKDAQRRLDELNLKDYDELFSLSVTGHFRLWGKMFDGVFCIIWIDPNHEICPSKKKNT